MMGTAKKALIFDADGTLYSVMTARAYSRLYNFLSGKARISKTEIKRRHRLELAKIRNSKNPRLRLHFHSIFGVVRNKRIAKMAEAEFWRGVEIKKDSGTKPSLEKLKAKGYLLAIASDEFSERLARKMELALGKNWKTHFDCIVTPESTGVMKPSARFYKLILKKLGLKAGQAMVVGNSWEKDLKPAARMEMATVLIGNKKEGKPDFFIRRISGLVRILGEWKR